VAAELIVIRMRRGSNSAPLSWAPPPRRTRSRTARSRHRTPRHRD